VTTTDYREARSASPPLPEPRGPLSSAVAAALAEGPSALAEEHGTLPGPLEASRADPYGDDLQLALHLLYELHYQGFEGVAESAEWDPEIIRARNALEQPFLSALRDAVPGRGLDDAFRAILREPPPGEEEGAGAFLAREGELWQVREYVALRSVYHLKEADPHAWAIPRLYGRAKAAMVAVEFDEFGAGRAEDVHARLFADLMDDLGLDHAYGRYVDAAPAEALATVNLMSLLGLHRSLRGALAGHFAHVETTSSPGSRRLAAAMRRVGAGAAAQRFYDEHVEADAVHEQVVRYEVVGPLAASDPRLAADAAFGVEATDLLEARLGAFLLARWRAGRSALRVPLR